MCPKQSSDGVLNGPFRISCFTMGPWLKCGRCSTTQARFPNTIAFQRDETIRVIERRAGSELVKRYGRIAIADRKAGRNCL